MPKKLEKRAKPDMHKDMKRLRIYLDDMGEVKMNMSADEINQFLKRQDQKQKIENFSEESE
jgi:hypothetical protein